MDIDVTPDGILVWDNEEYRCALGKNGVREDKQEGNGATPAGRFLLREVLYRADRLSALETALPISTIQPHDGWCDDPNDPNYNKKVVLPYPASHESLWRTDNLYDIVVPIGYNDAPAVPGKGSAIFIHVARADYAPTAGCIALVLPDLIEILRN